MPPSDRDRERAREWLTKRECEHQCFHDGGASLESLTDLLAEARAHGVATEVARGNEFNAALAAERDAAKDDCRRAIEARAQAETERDAVRRANESLHDQLRATKDAKSEIAELVAMRLVVAAALRIESELGETWDGERISQDALTGLHNAVAEYRRQHPTEASDAAQAT